MLKTLPVVAALLTAGVLVTPTVSQAADSNSVSVSYADLNLASSVGQHTLQRRIAGAARTVCVIEDSKELALAFATSACRGAAIADAQPAYEAAVNSARRGSVTVLDGAALIITAR